MPALHAGKPEAHGEVTGLQRFTALHTGLVVVDSSLTPSKALKLLKKYSAAIASVRSHHVAAPLPQAPLLEVVAMMRRIICSGDSRLRAETLRSLRPAAHNRSSDSEDKAQFSLR